MARSKEALKRRAEKRSRSIHEQYKADGKEMDRQAKKYKTQNTNQESSISYHKTDQSEITKPNIRREQRNLGLVSSEEQKEILQEPGSWICKSCGNHNFASRRYCNSKTCNEWRPKELDPPMSSSLGRRRELSSSKEQEEILQEAGSWVCTSCQNHNFASRRYCNSKTCNERRPKELDPPMSSSLGYKRESLSSFSNKKSSSGSKRPRHDPKTSKQLEWAPNATKDAIQKNSELRKQYQETGGEGMNEKDIERAKLLLERDARKREKKLNKTNKHTTIIEKTIIDSNTTIEEVTNTNKNTEQSLNTELVDDDDTQELSPAQSKSQIKDLAKKVRKENKKLRKKFLKTNGNGMSQDDIERAKILIERDERKRQKKLAATSTPKQ